jgi:high-affinity nickel permease
VFGLDEHIAGLGSAETAGLVCVVAILLGLRHATDPDHLTAVSTLIASEDEGGGRHAGRLGLMWGLGHATTLFVFGLPIVLFSSFLPERVQQLAEVGVGLVVMGLAVRLLLRWRRGRFHAHLHEHDGTWHRHLHEHEARRKHDAHGGHCHEHPPPLARSQHQAYGIGLIHGIGGSAGVGVLLLAAIPDHGIGIVALVLFALFTAVSMALASTGFGLVLGRERVARGMPRLAPVLGMVGLLFGAWYALAAVEAVPYYL